MAIPLSAMRHLDGNAKWWNSFWRKNRHADEVLQLLFFHSGYNPPPFILDAAKSALDRVDCNQYSPTKGRPRLKKALADAYTPFFGRTLNPETEVTITTGANEGGCYVLKR
jgi:aspartate/methionine/tyrosine aminotransferase